MSSWFKPKATEHDLIPPAPIDKRQKEEYKIKSWNAAGFVHLWLNWSQKGLACGMIVVNHSKNVPCTHGFYFLYINLLLDAKLQNIYRYIYINSN